MIKVTSLGGSGEDSRNCFLVESDELTLLLDCGVRREIAEVSRVYPLLTPEIASSLDAVLLSHAHEDHTAALPYLYELGYHSPIYASKETIEATPGFLRKWVGYVQERGGTLPFDPENIDKLRFEPIEAVPFDVSGGRDGHVVGGLWYRFQLGGHSLLYTGDYTFDSLLLVADRLPEAELLVIDSAYAGKMVSQALRYEMLKTVAKEVTERGGKLLLPVPVNGRGIDMFVYLSRYGLPLYVEENIVKNTAALHEADDWVKPFELPAEGFTVVSDANRAEILAPKRSGVYLFGDGMMTTKASTEYFAAVRDDERCKIMITGHSAKGTLANDLLRWEYREENGILPEVERMTIKVHNDEEDVLRLAEMVQPKHVMLFHSDAAACESLMERLTERGITAVCGVGKTIELP